MIRQLIRVAILVSQEPLVAAGFGFPDSSLYRNTVMASNLKLCCFFSSPPRLFSSLSSTSGHQLQLFSHPLFPTLHSLCPWDTPFIYFLLNFSALRDSFPAVPGGAESTLGVSQRLAGVGKDARGAKLWVGLGW